MSAKHTPITERPHPIDPDGVKKIFRFKNGYGASVIRSRLSYGGDKGLWELAVIKFEGPDSDGFELTYDTPITSDVEGHLSDEAVDALLDKIAALDKTGAA